MRQEPYSDALAAGNFDEVIDVRSPSEFEEDHIPGAVNLPVLSDEERALVGTIYVQEDRIKARCLGAAIIARNIAGQLDGHFADKPRNYEPLIYCWRGGQRSRSLATILGAVGWNPVLIAGGYKSYRKYVREKLAEMAPHFKFRVVSGLTGCGKTAFLKRGRALGFQILDLESMACHRGSLLGEEYGVPQPSQKFFESLLCKHLRAMDPEKPVFVESESKRIGSLQCPEPLWGAFIKSPVMELQATVGERARNLLAAYRHFVEHPEMLLAKLEVLRPTHGHAQVEEWKSQINAGQWSDFVESILRVHYDPAYRRCANFASPTEQFHLASISDESFDHVWKR